MKEYIVGSHHVVGAKNVTFENGDLILWYLKRLGIEFVFGVPGGSIEPLYNALARSEREGGPKAVIARHETGAALMAAGYALETGKLGVCCAISGPGTTNLITGVSSAYTDNIPLLVITAQTAITNFGQGSFQEASCTGINILGMLEHCTRYNTLISHSSQLESKLLQAISYATSAHPGPVHLSIPLDILRENAVRQDASKVMRAFINHDVVPCQQALDLLISDLSNCEKVTFVIGEGAIDAISEILELIESKGWLFVTTPGAKGLVSSYHPQYRGVYGFAGHKSAHRALQSENAERVVVVGAALDEVSTSGWDTTALMSDRLIHLSNNPEQLSRSIMARICVLGSLALIIKPFSELVENVQDSPAIFIDSDDFGLPKNIELDERDKCSIYFGAVKPQTFISRMSQVCPANTRVLFDSGTSFLWGIHYWNCRKPEGQNSNKNLFHIGINFASMGWAIGTSVGVAAATNGEPVVCVTGDGSFLMSGQEITTALQENLNLLFVIVNDSSLGMVKHGQRMSGAERVGCDLPKINYAKIGEAMAIESYRIETMVDFEKLDIPGILSRPGPCILDVLIDKDEVPPLSERIKVLAGSLKG